MICQNCGKREANVEYTQIINGNKIHLHLCEKCASEMKIGMDFSFDMEDMFSNFFNGFIGNGLLESPKILKCKTCGSTYDDFVNTGRLGCSDCYDTFGDELDNILKRLHGNNRNVESRKENLLDKIKEKKEKKDELSELKDELKECIKKEEYEKAAEIRDKIKKLEK